MADFSHLHEVNQGLRTGASKMSVKEKQWRKHMGFGRAEHNRSPTWPRVRGGSNAKQRGTVIPEKVKAAAEAANGKSRASKSAPSDMVLPESKGVSPLGRTQTMPRARTIALELFGFGGGGIDLDISASGNGVLVYGVDPSGPAALRIMVGEKVVGIGGTTVTNLHSKDELDRILAEHSDGDTLVLKLMGREEITPVSKEMDRHTKIQRRLSLSSMPFATQAVSVPIIPKDSVGIRRSSISQERTHEDRRVNNEFMGQDAGMKTSFGTDATQLLTENRAQRRLSIDLSQIVSQEMRGADAGKQTAYGADATQMSTERKAQRRLSDYRRVNEQVANDTGYDMPHDEIVTRRVKRDQGMLAKARRQSGIALVGYGEKTGFSNDATQLVTESGAQTHTHAVRRVNEQARGANVGEKTLYDGQAQSVQRARRNSLANSDLHAVNEQVLLEVGTAPPTIPVDNVTHRRASINQLDVAAVRMVNEQLRGEAVGQKTLVAIDSAQYDSQQKAQRRLSTQMMVNTEMQGEYAGMTTNFTVGAKAFELAKVAPKKALVNQQVYGTGVGKLSIQDVEFRRASIGQVQVGDVRRINEQFRGEQVGQQTGFSADATQLVTEAKAQAVTHNYLRVNEQLRGETVGRKTSVNYDSTLVQLARNAPKKGLEKAGILLGRATPSAFAASGGVDASHGKPKGPGWRPMSEDVGVYHDDLEGIESDDEEEIEQIDPIVISTILTSIFRSAWKADITNTPTLYILPRTAFSRVQYKYCITEEEVTESLQRLKMFLSTAGANKSPAQYFVEAVTDDFGRVTVRAFLEACDPIDCIEVFHKDGAKMRAKQVEQLAIEEERVLRESQELRAKVEHDEAEATEQGKLAAKKARAMFQ